MAGWGKEPRSPPTLLRQGRAPGTNRIPERGVPGWRSFQMAFSLFGSRKTEYILTSNMELNLWAKPASSSGCSHQLSPCRPLPGVLGIPAGHRPQSPCCPWWKEHDLSKCQDIGMSVQGLWPLLFRVSRQIKTRILSTI